MAKVLLKHYLWLIDKLSRRPMTLAELSESYEQSSLYETGKGLKPRTLYNWREKIAELFGLEIHYAHSTYRLEHPERLGDNSPGRWLVQSLSVNESVRQCKGLRKRILLEDIPSGKRHLTTIIDAMQANHVLRMTYRRFTDTENLAPIDVEPYCVKVNSRRWYMLCRVLSDFAQAHEPSVYDCFGALKIYALDRIQSLEETGAKFTFPADFSPDVFFANHFGVCIAYGIPMQRIQIKVSCSLRNYILSLPLHPSQREMEHSTDHSIFSYELHPTIDFRRTLLSFGADAEVLSPTALREELATEVMRMKSLYEK